MTANIKRNEIFQKLVTKLYKKIFAYYFSILKDRELAKDICHDTFIKIKEKPDLSVNKKRCYFYLDYFFFSVV